MAEYMIICCDRHLLTTVEKLERSKDTLGGNGLGEWTRRIDFRMQKETCPDSSDTAMTADNVVRLLRCTPNLSVFVNTNTSNTVEFETPSEIIQALVTSCGKSLRRLEWNFPSERPSWSHLQKIRCNVPNLETLRVACIPSLPPPPPVDATLVPLMRLRTLSLGFVPPPSQPAPDPQLSLDALLSWLAISKDQLPALERLEVATLPNLSFFRTHGHKIRCLRITSWSTPGSFPTVLHLCPNLQNLTFSLKRSEELHLPTSHPSLQRICIFPFNEDFLRVPSWLFSTAVLGPLDSLLMTIENMDLPELTQVRIRNVGAFADLVDHSGWLQLWWRRWNIRRVRFEDKSGKTFESACPDEDELLDTLRG